MIIHIYICINADTHIYIHTYVCMIFMIYMYTHLVYIHTYVYSSVAYGKGGGGWYKLGLGLIPQGFWSTRIFLSLIRKRFIKAGGEEV